MVTGSGTATARAMPGLCTLAQETGPSPDKAPCGARLWQTHATVAPENSERAPELATAPTRRLVSHAGVDATAQSTVTHALDNATALLQHMVVSVDQPESFKLQVGDLYPPMAPAQEVRTHAVHCRNHNAI
jgi:hypothetical protein